MAHLNTFSSKDVNVPQMYIGAMVAVSDICE